MDFDLKSFFVESPRIKDEVRAHMHQLATTIVIRFVAYAKQLQVERILPRHVRMIAFQMAQDPLLRCSRQGLCVQKTAIKSLQRILTRAFDDVDNALKQEIKHGGIDRKIVKQTGLLLEKHDQKASTAAVVSIAACVAEICGVMLNSTAQNMTEKTMTLSLIHEHACTHITSSGERCRNASLHRFLVTLDRPLMHAVQAVRTAQTSDKKTGKRKAEPPREQPSARPKSEKAVHFHSARPTTPDNCFWDD